MIGEILTHLKLTAEMMELLLGHDDISSEFARTTMRGHVASIGALVTRVEQEQCPDTIPYPTYPSVIEDYARLKKQHPDVIIFFRLGDFYETFDGDAEIASRELDLILLVRKDKSGNDVRMCGVPYYCVADYVARLLEKGMPAVMLEPRIAVKSQGSERSKE